MHCLRVYTDHLILFQMKFKKLMPLTAALFVFGCSQGTKTADQNKREVLQVTLKEDEAGNKVDVMIDGKLFTSYRWPDSVYKPILYPILTAQGTPVTRGFPIKTRSGERQDHRHQVGNWFNYGNVNGYDFWGNGSTGKRNETNGGQIIHRGIGKLKDGEGEASMEADASWVDPEGKELLSEHTVFHFIANDSIRIIDRIATWTATNSDVLFEDTKEGSFGIRVARQLELPSKEDVTLTDAQGNPTTVSSLSNDGITGNYRSSEGVTGEAVWGTRAKWMELYGSIGDENISLVIVDHPKNLSYPTYWHARGYGLFAANPFGVKDFTEGAEELNFTLTSGASLTMRYRIIVNDGAQLTGDQINAYAEDFAGKY